MAAARRYKLLWDQIKQVGHAQLEYDRALHERVMRALRKESDLDGGFRFKCIEEGRSYKITFSQLDDLLLISLEWQDKIPAGFVLTPERVNRRQSWQVKEHGRKPRKEDFEL